MQSIYKQMRARFKFGAYRNNVGAEVFMLSYTNSYTSYQFWEASILLHARLLHGANHSFKHQHATEDHRAGNHLWKNHFTLLCPKSLANFPATLFHDLHVLLDSTTVYSPQSHKSAFLDGVIAVNLYTFKSSCLKKLYTVCFSVCLFIYIHTCRRSNHAIYRCSWANGLLLHK